MRLTDIQKVWILMLLTLAPMTAIICYGFIIWWATMPSNQRFFFMVLTAVALVLAMMSLIVPRLSHWRATRDKFEDAYVYNDGEPVDVQVIPTVGLEEVGC